jgi:hypothetical protein
VDRLCIVTNDHSNIDRAFYLIICMCHCVGVFLRMLDRMALRNSALTQSSRWFPHAPVILSIPIIIVLPPNRSRGSIPLSSSKRRIWRACRGKLKHVSSNKYDITVLSFLSRALTSAPDFYRKLTISVFASETAHINGVFALNRKLTRSGSCL